MSRTSPLWISLFAIALLAFPGCSSPGPTSSASFKGDLADQGVQPLRQAIDLRIDPDATDYSGSVRIDLEFSDSTDTFQFHGEEMTFDRVVLEGPDGATELTTEVGEKGLVTARAASVIEAGRYTLTVDFHKEYDTRAVGLYRMEQDGHGYLFTQMEAIDARKGFPCWDEPRFKIPFQMTLRAPEGHTIVTNTPLESESVVEGWKTHVASRASPAPLPG